MAKAQPKTAAPDAVTTEQVADQQDQQQAADAAAQASETQALATAGVVEDQVVHAATQQDHVAEEVQLVDVRVLAAVTIGGERFQPDDVIEGMPENVAQAYAGSVDPHPDAVAYARANGGDVVQYQDQEEDEDQG